MRSFPDFSNSLEWNLVTRRSLVNRQLIGGYVRLPPLTVNISNSHLLMIGVASNSAKSHWYTAGWARQFLNFSPSSTSVFPVGVQTVSHRLALGTLNCLTFAKEINDWTLQIAFPVYLEDALVEIWRYDGTDLSVFERIDLL